MAFNQQYYNEIKEFALHYLSHRPFHPSYTGTPMSHTLFIVGYIADAIREEDFEMAQALKDAVMEFVNEHSDEKLTKDVLLIIPEWKERDPICGIICCAPKPGEWGYIPDDI